MSSSEDTESVTLREKKGFVWVFGRNPQNNYPLKKSKTCAGMGGKSREAVMQYPGAPLWVQSLHLQTAAVKTAQQLSVICEVQL